MSNEKDMMVLLIVELIKKNIVWKWVNTFLKQIKVLKETLKSKLISLTVQ